MFLPSADATCLRQGDILRDVPIPLLSIQRLVLLGVENVSGQQPGLTAATSDYSDGAPCLTGQVPIRKQYCAVVTQCCDLEAPKGKPRSPFIAVARLRRIHDNLSAEQLELLRSNPNPLPGNAGFLGYFYLGQHDLLGGDEFLVDYSQLFSFPGRELGALLSRKVLQMEDRTRVMFKIKLATVLMRLTDDERNGGLENPWATKAPAPDGA